MKTIDERRGRWARPTFYGASLAVVLWAGLAVPMPFVEYLPGQPQPIAPLIQIEGAGDNERQIDVSMLTVVVRQQPPAQVLAAWFDGERRLLPVERVFPQDIDRSEYQRRQRVRFSHQFEIAAVVGARAAGVDAELMSGVVVTDVVEGSASDGHLEPGDVVRAVNGRIIEAADELHRLVVSRNVGDDLVLTVVREGSERTVVIRLGEIAGLDGPRLGITIQTAVEVVRLPFEISLADGVRIGGPSAGLMIGLTVYAMLADDDPLAGWTIAGTGSLDADGSVGAVGGVPEKVRAAIESGVDVVFVPTRQLEEAQQVHGVEATRLIGVASLDEAIAALRELSAGGLDAGPVT